ncbi:tetratricopeptide repeat protein [Tenacibaculum crassostreae]|uniref:tetratricopeptide repeat protein n=1 Tax=Tenacibaculum crassostreae TaxID=502683 RepID=UPI0038939A3B
MVLLKKFFKVLGLIILISILLFLLFLTYITYDSKNKYEEFKQKVENFESLNSEDYRLYSEKFNKSGDFKTGFKYLNKAVELEPSMHLGYRGWIHLRKLRNYSKALEDFNRLDSLTPNAIDAPWGEDIDFLRGECYFGKKEYQKAIAYFNQSIKNQKGEEWADIQTMVYLGICEYKLNNYENAIIEFKRALKQSEYTCEAHFWLAKIYVEQYNHKLANEHILKAEETIEYKRDDRYNEFLNELYLSEIIELKEQLNRIKT